MQTTASRIVPCEAMSERECDARIVAAKRALGGRQVIPDHHFLRDGVFRYAGFSGDSLKLARRACEPGRRRLTLPARRC
ncbi:MAG: quinolinate synthase NadA [Thiogranum sp.]|jgi:quinolinate synthase